MSLIGWVRVIWVNNGVCMKTGRIGKKNIGSQVEKRGDEGEQGVSRGNKTEAGQERYSCKPR